MLYANAVNNTITNGEDFRNGIKVMETMKRQSFKGNHLLFKSMIFLMQSWQQYFEADI